MDINADPHIILRVHTLRVVDSRISLVLAPDDVSAENAEEYSRICSLHLQNPIILLKLTGNGGYKLLHSETPIGEKILSGSGGIPWGDQALFYSGELADELPTWPPS